MDRRVMRERMRRKQRQIRRRKIIKLVTYVVAMVLAIVFVIRGIIFPIINRIGGGSTGNSQAVQAESEVSDPTVAVRQPLKGQADAGKISTMTPGWHEDETGRWYQNADGTYYESGFADIEGVKYAFDDSGYMETGWFKQNNNWYYLDPARGGKMVASEWMLIDGRWYHFYGGGGMETGWTKGIANM